MSFDTPAASTFTSVSSSATTLLCALLLAGSLPSSAADLCKSRGLLDEAYCDDDGDLVANTPKDPKLLKDPATLYISNSPLEDPALYEKQFEPYVQHLVQCTGKKIKFFSVLSNAAAIEAMRSGRVHIGMFASGDTAFAVNLAGAVPFAIRGDAKGPQGYKLITIVKASSPFKTLADLKGKRVAHTAPSSNSGNLAPRALFPAAGLKPDVDYKPFYSGKHENSVTGVSTGDYDAAAIADDVLERMADRGVVKRSDFRVIFESAKFPPSAVAYAHNLLPDLQQKIRDCSYSFKYSAELIKAFQGADRWLPVNYKKDWELVRVVGAAGGETFDRKSFEKAQVKK